MTWYSVVKLAQSLYSNPILVATDIIVRITDLRKRQKMNIIDELNDFINQTCIV
jgi:hypothetical protein